jgi:hypothetical protein
MILGGDYLQQGLNSISLQAIRENSARIRTDCMYVSPQRLVGLILQNLPKRCSAWNVFVVLSLSQEIYTEGAGTVRNRKEFLNTIPYLGTSGH